MRKYTRLSSLEREKIFTLLSAGKLLKEIGALLDRSGSTITRELQRFKEKALYQPDLAQAKAFKSAGYRRNIGKFRHSARQVVIDYGLREGYSPEQIAGRLKLEHSPHYLCAEAIYRWIYSQEGLKLGWRLLLLRHHPRRKKRSERKKRKPHMSHMVNVSERSEVANNRQEFGHFEADLVVFTTKSSPNIGVMIERKTRFSKLSLNRSKKTDEVIGNMTKTMKELPLKRNNKPQSIAFDQGKEFAHHHDFYRKPFGMKTYFCNPHSPWQKGAVENLNGILRRFLPLSYDYSALNFEILQTIEDKINAMPRKVLGFKTAKEAFQEHCKSDIWTKKKIKKLFKNLELKSKSEATLE
jgi:transposase, IS30 family